MYEPKFTPGSWLHCTHDEGSAICVADGLDHTTVANVCDSKTGARAANAALIAAAPDLFEVCEQALGDLAPGDYQMLKTDIRAALTKARGEK